MEKTPTIESSNRDQELNKMRELLNKTKALFNPPYIWDIPSDKKLVYGDENYDLYMCRTNKMLNVTANIYSLITIGKNLLLPEEVIALKSSVREVDDFIRETGKNGRARTLDDMAQFRKISEDLVRETEQIIESH